MWNKLLRADLNCGWRTKDGYCLLRSKVDKNGLWRQGVCKLPCRESRLDIGQKLKELQDETDKKKKHRHVA